LSPETSVRFIARDDIIAPEGGERASNVGSLRSRQRQFRAQALRGRACESASALSRSHRRRPRADL